MRALRVWVLDVAGQLDSSEIERERARANTRNVLQHQRCIRSPAGARAESRVYVGEVEDRTSSRRPVCRRAAESEAQNASRWVFIGTLS